MLNTVILIVILNGIFHSEAYRESIKIPIKDLHWKFNGIEKWYYQKEDYGVSAEKPFKIILSDWHGKGVVCRSLYYPYEFSNQFHKKDNDTVIIIREVNDTMSTTWKCTLKYNNDSIKDIYFDVNVKDATPPQMILVNNVVLPTQKVHSEDYQTGIMKYEATCNYKIGDYVDVACINPLRGNCFVALNYDYVNSLSGRKVNMNSSLRVGFRTTFKAIHDNSRMTCNYFCEKKEPIEVAVTFKLLEELGEDVEMKINGYTVRGTQIKNDYNANVNSYIKYAYIFENNVINPIINFTYEMNADNIDFRPNCQGCVTNNANKNFTKQTYFVTKDIKLSKVNYVAIFKNLLNLKKTLEVGFTTLNAKFNARNPLKLNLPKDNILIELYEDNKHTMFYYEYDEGVDLSLICSMPSEKGRKLSFEGKEVGHSRYKYLSINQIITLDQSYKNTSIHCEKKNNTGVVIAQVQVWFLMKVRNATSLVVTPKLTTSSTTSTTTTTSTTSTSTTSTTSTSTTSTTSTSTTSTTITPTTTTSTTTSSTTFFPTSTTISTPIATNSTISTSTITNSNTGGGNEKIIIIVVVIMVIIVVACIGTILYNRKKRNHYDEDEPIVYYKKTSNAADPAVYDYAIPDVQRRLIVEDDIYAKPVPKSLRQSKNYVNNYANHVIPNTYANHEKIGDDKSYDNQPLQTDIYSEVMPKQNIPYTDQNNSGVENTNIKTDYGNIQNMQRSHDGENAYTNQAMRTDIYSQVVPKSRRSKTYANTSLKVAHNTDLIDFEPTYSELTIKNK